MTTPHQLRDGSLLLHVGPQKTGSTAIQMSMHENREQLAAQGVAYPGKDMRPRNAGWAVLGGSAIGRPTPGIEVWDEFVAEVRASTLPRTCVSNEDFGRADEATVARILEDLGAESTHLVFVARRLDKLLPSHWQERVKARMTKTYSEFLHHVLETPDIDWEARVTWEPHDVALLLERWGRHLPPERITVIVSDEADRTFIPAAFEDLLGLTRGTLKPPSANTNTSLSFTQTEAVRRLNQLSLDEEWTPEQYWRVIQAGAVKALRKAGPDSTSGPDLPSINGLPGWAYSMVSERAQAQVAAITGSGVNVIGDPSRLLLEGNVEPAELPATPEALPLDLVADLVSGTVDGAATLHRLQRRAANQAKKAASPDQLSGREMARALTKKASRKLRGR